MRFAIVGNSAASMTNFRGPLIARISGMGHTVYALAPDFDQNTRAIVSSLGAEPVDYPLARTGLNPVSDIADARALFEILRDLELDGVLCFGIKPAIYGTLAARLAGIANRYALITGLGYAFIESSRTTLKRRLVGIAAQLLYRQALRHAQRVFMQNPNDADDFVRLGIIERDRIVTVNGTGLDLDEWRPAPPVTQPITFLLAARLLKDKGIHEYVEAARLVKTTHPDIRFVLIGAHDTNPDAIPAEQLASWLQEGVIEWPGHVDARTWLGKASVFVLPSYREGVPRSSQEAMALSRPIITTNVPGCRETVIEGVNGYLVPPRNVPDLAAAMYRFIQNPDSIAAMGQAGRVLATEKFNVHEINTTMTEAMNLHDEMP